MRPSLEDKVDKIFEMVHAQNVQFARHIGFQENHTEMLKEHKAKIESLEGYKNKAIGAGVAGTTLGAILGTVGGWLAKHW